MRLLKWLIVTYMWLCNCFRAISSFKRNWRFQILLGKAKKRGEFEAVCHESCSTEQLYCFGTGSIYIRPLQKSIIPLTRSVHVKQEFQACLPCGESFGISEMRRNLETGGIVTLSIGNLPVLCRREAVSCK